MASRCFASLLAILWLCIPAASLADEEQGHGHDAGKAQASGGPPATNENANPQGAEGATRGQDRAAERAGEHQKGADEGTKGAKETPKPKPKPKPKKAPKEKGAEKAGAEKAKGHAAEPTNPPSGEAAPK